MLKINNLTKLYGGRGVLNSATFAINTGERAGLVGPSGSGKTTLLRIIAGEERPDGGSVERTAGARIGYLRQGYAGHAHRTAAEMFPSLFSVMEDDADLEVLATRMAAAADPAEAGRLSQAYADALDRLSSNTNGAAVRQTWQALGLREVAPAERIGTLSGGEQTKLGLLDLVAGLPDILLLDEPTNNLDIAGLRWLDGFLDTFTGPVLLVSHDRAVLDDHATVILELDPESGAIEAFPGAYTDYAEEKSRRRSELWQRYQRQQKHIREVQSAIAGLSAKAQNIENETIHFYFRKRAKKVARRAVTLKARLQRELDSADHLDKPVRQPHRVRATIAEGDRAGARMLAAEGVTIGIGNLALARDIDLAVGWGEHIVIVGPNGGGKTTLLRTLLGECQPLAGTVTRGPSARIGYLPQRTDLEQGASDSMQTTPLAVIRAAAPLNEGEARRFLHRFLFTSDQVFTPLHRLSYGERRRLHLAHLVVAGVNLLILDEPTNHLDLGAREAFESALEDYDGAVLAVTHDRYFIERFAHRTLNLEAGRLTE